MKLLPWRCWAIGAVILAAAWGQLAPAAETAAPDQQDNAAWAPQLYGLCMDTHDAKRRTIPQQAAMLAELGFDGVGYPLWLDDNLETNLRTLDEAGLKVYLLYVRIKLKPGEAAVDGKITAAIRKLKGRPVTICVLLQGLPPADPRGEAPALKVLRELGDAAAEAGLRVSIYHHVGDWTQSLLHALQVVDKLDHPQVGANFNLCHWLKVDGDKDYRAVLREHADKIFAVTINGAQLGTNTWTNGLIQPLDRGDFDNRALLATLREIGYRGPIGLMCYGIGGDAREHLQRSINVWDAWEAEWTPQ
jgi:sugar phosphate isomerase/epimerase